MANLYDTTNKCCSSSSAAELDDISLFLQQFLLRPSGKAVVENRESGADVVRGLSRISASELCSGLNFPAGGCFPVSAVANIASSSVGTLDNDPDDYDCESEEAIEASVEEAAPNPTNQRNSSKRSRDAEVHNLSEKRRRSRINEKMKALQNLIPNSNKTDKASMLDEAIEYLKQLQLQVQMLTVRNGLSVYPICLPSMLQPNQIPQIRPDSYEGTRSLNMNMKKAAPIDQETSTEATLSLQDNGVERMLVSNFSTMINSRTVFQTESSIQEQFGQIQLLQSSQEICQEEILPFKHQVEDCPQNTLTCRFVNEHLHSLEYQCHVCTSSFGSSNFPFHEIKGYRIGFDGNTLLPLDAQPSNINSITLERSCFHSGDLLGSSVNLPSSVNNLTFSPQFTGSHNGVRLSSRIGKSEGDEFCFDGSTYKVDGST